MRRAGLIVVLFGFVIAFCAPAGADSIPSLEARESLRLLDLKAKLAAHEQITKQDADAYFRLVFQEALQKAKSRTRVAVRPAYIKSAHTAAGSLASGTATAFTDLKTFVLEIASLCYDGFRSSAKTCDLDLDTLGDLTAAPSPLPSLGPPPASPPPQTPGPIESLTPIVTVPPDTAQADFDAARVRIGLMQAAAPNPAQIPACPLHLSNFCAVMASPLPAPSPLRSLASSPARWALPIPRSSPLGTIEVDASVAPPLLGLPTAANVAPSGVASANGSITFTPSTELSANLLNALPAESPIPIAYASAEVDASPAPSSVAQAELSAGIGDVSLYRQSFPIDSVLRNYGSLASASKNVNVCPGSQKTGEPLVEAFPIVPSGGALTIVFTIWCPLSAGYLTNVTWTGDDFFVLAAPYLSLGVDADASAEGFGGLAVVGGQASLNVVSAQLRIAGFGDSIYDTDVSGSPRALIAGAYAFGNYYVGGGDLYAYVRLLGYTVNIHILRIAPTGQRNFETTGPSFTAVRF